MFKIFGERNKYLHKFYILTIFCFVVGIGLIIANLIEESDNSQEIFCDLKMVFAYIFIGIGLIISLYVTFKNNKNIFI